MMHRITHPTSRSQPPAGFTMIELLVSISIMLLLLGVTAFAVNFNRDAERVRGSASLLRSYLAGARDRALYEKKAVGVRLFLDSSGNQTNVSTVSSLAYIEQPDLWPSRRFSYAGFYNDQIFLERWDGDNNGIVDSGLTNINDFPLDVSGNPVSDDDPDEVWVVSGYHTGWWHLKRRRLLVDDSRIRIDNGAWYPISTKLIDVTQPPPSDGWQKLILKVPHGDAPDNSPPSLRAYNETHTYVLELAHTFRPEEPRLLSDQTVIDLESSKIPAAWGPHQTAAGGTEYSRTMDIMFSPRGNVIGSAASSGLVHFYICDGNDAITLKDYFATLAAVPSIPWVPADVVNLSPDPANPSEDNDFPVNDRRVVSVFTQTGNVTVNSINPTDISGGPSGTPNGLADDPFLFAEVGSEAN